MNEAESKSNESITADSPAGSGDSKVAVSQESPRPSGAEAGGSAANFGGTDGQALEDAAPGSEGSVPPSQPRPAVSARKAAASRANGSKSHGPRTEQGKQCSKMNAFKHGRYAEPPDPVKWLLAEPSEE